MRADVAVRTPRAPPVFSRVVRLTNGPAREFAPAISPDGKWVAYLSNASGPQDVWIKFIAGGDAANLTASAGLDISMTAGVGGPAYFPRWDARRCGGQSSAAVQSPFAAWEIPAPLPGRPRKLLEDGFYGLRWSPDGKQIAYIRAGSSAGDALWVADDDGTNRREIIKAQNGMHVHWPAWSRDGFIYFMRTFATVSNLDQTEIYRVRESGGPMEVVVATPRRAMYPFPLADGGLLYLSESRLRRFEPVVALGRRRSGSASDNWCRRLRRAARIRGRPHNRTDVERTTAGSGADIRRRAGGADRHGHRRIRQRSRSEHRAFRGSHRLQLGSYGRSPRVDRAARWH